jgi:hypothetical protein
MFTRLGMMPVSSMKERVAVVTHAVNLRNRFERADVELT